ncbi:hypothetical protein EV356DRAFT_510334 [Viridothelium virens]|uniref:Uncharacterized protein n=1 Tax=Viridothelium virens TaxID=1048519 RepID=A0A6A6GV47_VIRVR|nr:hypothetical protein EV356DRAFT_510334 [Viridothelium virens]
MQARAALAFAGGCSDEGAPESNLTASVRLGERLTTLATTIISDEISYNGLASATPYLGRISGTATIPRNGRPWELVTLLNQYMNSGTFEGWGMNPLAALPNCISSSFGSS